MNEKEKTVNNITLQRKNTELDSAAISHSKYNDGSDSHELFNHFSTYFRALVAKESSQFEAAHLMRHKIFCEELKVFNSNKTGLESDGYDNYAEQLLIQHMGTLHFCGCVRLIIPQNQSQALPIEKHGIQYCSQTNLLPNKFKREEIAEVSRIAIPREFRRRKIDKSDCAATTGIDIDLYDESDIRCFPFIGVGLYMACAALIKNRRRKHIYFMAEPKLGQSMQFIGLKMTKLGDEFEYVGRRVPYYLNIEQFIEELKPSFKFMLANFIEVVR